ncbi:transposase IS4 family protein [Emticicia oligotrophica DSM 17448]|uniref:Transposase IS4 family protein n=1 Tax=Emticicia oligotrophica (strain DSM 17448 / CIP 109782 / MTCC 6937 / GPTSA100-15) TaxID=929562 RepID=A0ABM5N4M4_EMTOG|nr:IS5 family transposase [Emticicia oligotrophica]AFK04322.1 transposase IS4 family protein [Emticicia oligotrophica DSM 17448]
MGILNKSTIEKWILPHLPIGERGFETTVPLIEIVECILYRLKTGCQWRELPTKQFFTTKILVWESVYYYFNKWSKSGCWQKIWSNILNKNLKHLDLSSIEFDGSHTPAKNGGDAIGYQGRKACNTTNALFMSDNQGVILGMSTPQEGHHHDLFEIQTLFKEICDPLKKAGINLKGLFLNADPGFDSDNFRKACEYEDIIPNVKPNTRNDSEEQRLEPYICNTHIFDEELYKDRSVIEHSNAWIDGFKALLIRFEFSVKNWVALHFIAFSVIFLRKIIKKIKV